MKKTTKHVFAVNVRFDKEGHEQLKSLADTYDTPVSMSHIIRVCVAACAQAEKCLEPARRGLRWNDGRK